MTAPLSGTQPSASITFSGVSFAWPDGTPVFDGLSFTVPNAVYSLIGANGVGKSTLLALIAGRLRPHEGSITAQGEVGLVTQDAYTEPATTLAAALGIAPILDAISRIEAGSVDERDFTVVGDAWDAQDLSLIHI